MRKFETGATRDTDTGKLDYEGFLSPFAEQRFAEYMHKNRRQADGQMRDSDNWQKGIPLEAYMKSWHRHFMAVWKSWRLFKGGVLSFEAFSAQVEDDLCATKFNNNGFLHEIVIARVARELGCPIRPQEALAVPVPRSVRRSVRRSRRKAR